MPVRDRLSTKLEEPIFPSARAACSRTRSQRSWRALANFSVLIRRALPPIAPTGLASASARAACQRTSSMGSLSARAKVTTMSRCKSSPMPLEPISPSAFADSVRLCNELLSIRAQANLSTMATRHSLFTGSNALVLDNQITTLRGFSPSASILWWRSYASKPWSNVSTIWSRMRWPRAAPPRPTSAPIEASTTSRSVASKDSANFCKMTSCKSSPRLPAARTLPNAFATSPR
mmetsp:Transcript_45732/g.131913  ORF Transcript_45732/g.131913 Transcript_45732/m.131913 type:complete len:233 (-) Transcript_45732:234-932(-)